MSIHPSLGKAGKDSKQGSVLKRTERLRAMMEKDRWKEGDDVYGLPKIKTVRIKIKKEKVEKAEAVTAEGAVAPAAAGAEVKKQAPGKAAATSKPAAAPKGTEKK